LTKESKTSCGLKATSCAACDKGFACAQGHCVVDTGQCSSASCPSGCCFSNYCWQPSDQFYGACGKGGANCQTCTYGGSCSNGECSDTMDASAKFSIRVTAINVKEHDPNGNAWDSMGGLPDPFVCMGTS